MFSAARYATVCEETPLPWPRGAPFGERAQRARRPRQAALGAGAFFPFRYEEAKGRRDRPLPALGGGVRAAPVTGGAYPEGPGFDPPGRRGPAHPAGGLGVRGGRR